MKTVADVLNVSRSNLAERLGGRSSYNEDRPHSAIGYKVPITLHNPGRQRTLGAQPALSPDRFELLPRPRGVD